MFIPFNQLPKTARIWVFTSGRLLSSVEVNKISSKLESFIETWQSHQKDMKASFLVVENRFIVIAADEMYNDISGCGIDKSIHALQNLENDLGISLTDKSLVVFDNNGTQLSLSFNKIRDAISNGLINGETFFYNTLVEDLSSLQNNFKVKSSEGWVKKYFSVLTF